MAEKVVTDRATTTRLTAEKIETDPKRIAKQLANALREAGYECLIVLPSSH